MAIQYLTSINETDKAKTLLLIDASIQAYHAFNKDTPAECQTEKIISPAGYEFVECWTGIDAIFGEDKTVENYGIVFRSQVSPYTYIFAFRGTSSFLDILDDLGAESKAFTPHNTRAQVPSGVKVESGFFDVYSESDGPTPSMQTQLFNLIDTYNASDKPIGQLYITGHSLGSALSELFTLDVALSRPEVNASNYNYACPRVGNKEFVRFYERQSAQCQTETRTIRIQNTYDEVPRVPPEILEYQHISPAYLIAFYREGWLEKSNLLDRHSALNYQAVLTCAAKSDDGVCVDQKLEVPANGYAVTSKPGISLSSN